ncbi:MAG: hypothetical protein GTN70_10760 [Deltaproteobacteria bacterium]|nr:hypothetical protein [Deltaproteobacteria bacterium]NIS78256.1 hypothetical protein [Deltaproteobacteria bacterium]
MRRLLLVAALLSVLSLALVSCSHGKKDRAWEPGDTIICPHCGRDFTVPEKVGD